MKGNGQALGVAMHLPTQDSWFGVSDETHPMALLLNEIENSLLEPQFGEIRTGIVVDKRPHELLVDIGYKSEGVVAGREVERISDEFQTLKIGDEIPVFIMREDKDGNLLLSVSRALAEKDWERAEKLMDQQDIFDGIVETFNRGGVIIRVGHVRGFVPASQLSSSASESGNDANNGDGEGDERWASLIGETLKLKVIDVDRKRNRLILSERLAMRDWRRQQKEQLLDTLKEGDTYEGVISNIADFGAFVDLGGADGLIHLSELSWNRVNHPSEVVTVGDKVKVQILSVDLDRKRIGLSMRRLMPEPWEIINEYYEVGQIVRGHITKLVNFGAFARLDSNGVEGLIHISELSDQRVAHPREVVKEGEEHNLRIIRIDTDKRRMGLSLKQAIPVEEKPELDWQIAPSDAADVSENGVTKGATMKGASPSMAVKEMDGALQAAD